MPAIVKLNIKPTEEIMRAIVGHVDPVVDEMADELRFRVEESTYRSKSGRVYPSRREPGAMHRASAPGEPFASDTASLVSTMKKHRLAPMVYQVLFDDARWAIFEFGNGRISARPTIIPAAESLRPEFYAEVGRAAIDGATAADLQSR